MINGVGVNMEEKQTNKPTTRVIGRMEVRTPQ